MIERKSFSLHLEEEKRGRERRNERGGENVKGKESERKVVVPNE